MRTWPPVWAEKANFANKNMYERKIKEDLDCGIIVAMKVFGAKWKPCIIDAIHSGAKRPSELHRLITGASARVIDMQLSELVEHGVVTRKIHMGFPLHVEYSLTQLGNSIVPVLATLNAWGLQHKDLVKETVEKSNTLKEEMSEMYEATICSR